MTGVNKNVYFEYLYNFKAGFFMAFINEEFQFILVNNEVPSDGIRVQNIYGKFFLEISSFII